MKLFKNLCVHLFGLVILTFLAIIVLTLPQFAWIHSAFLSAAISVFSVSLVCLFTSLAMYKNNKDSAIITLKRRCGRVYAELLHHKMRLIDVMDGKSTFVDIEKYLFPEDAFIKIKKFIYEEYFLLFNYDPFLKNTQSYMAVNELRSMHKTLVTYVRSQHFDVVEYHKFKVLYQKIYRQPIVDDTPEENFNHPDLIDSLENFRSGLDYAYANAEEIMTFIENQYIFLDSYFKGGTHWKTLKEQFDKEFQQWVTASGKKHYAKNSV